MGSKSLNKGKEAEREIVRLLQPAVDEVYAQLQADYKPWFKAMPPLLQRNTLQAHRGGQDVVGLAWIAPEVKHHAKVSRVMVDAWWRQCVGQARDKQTPVLFYRGDNEPWRVRMPGKCLIGDKDNTGRELMVPLVVDCYMDAWMQFFKAKQYTTARNTAWRECNTQE